MSRWMYDVYLSFGGPDIRKTFVDHLYNGLKRNGIHVCMDESVLGGPEVINDPIEKSRFLMVIISDKYVSSSLCLRKLVKILKLSKNSSEHKIIPVFYNFDPELVREQCGSYAEAFAKHKESNEAEVDEWRKALSMAASLYGWVLNSETNGYEYKFIDHISKEILKMLSDAPLHAGIWVHKSELNYHHPNHSKRRLAIFWDMENCCTPNGVHPQDVYDNILACLRQQTEIEWEVIMFSVYADLLNVSPKVSEGCMKADMNLRHVPNGINDGSGKAILVDLFLYAHDNPPPSSIMLISGDVGFSSALQVLHRRRHPVIFVIPSRVGILSALTYGAIDIWDWTNVVRGEGLVPSSRFQIKENSDAVNKEESMESGVSMGSQPSFEYNPDDVYDVYLSFRGLDTRKTFVDHLYNGLKRNALHVCIYDNVLGGPKEIDDVIEKSRFLMVIFSDNYASSSSCLRELVKILDLSANDPEHKFIPVFYNVTPQMVGEQCESYAGAFADHEVSNKAEVDEWRKALSMAASFPGWVINSETNGYEYKFIDDMSKEIRNMLSDAPLHAGIWVHKSELNYHHPNHSKRQLAIFWDMENCCIPNGVHPKEVYDNILACLRNQTELEWEVIRFSAYADFSNVSRNISDGCMKARMNLSHVPNVINNASGKAILVDLLFYAHDNPPPSSIMLISGDVGFSNALHVLHRRRHPVIFVIPSRLGVLSALTYGTIDIWDWSNVVRGEWLVPTSRFQIKENSDAVNKEKSMESGVSMGSQPSSEYNPDDVMPVQPGDSEAQGASAGQAESSSAGSPTNQPVHEAVGQLTIPEEEPIQAAPASSKSMRFPLRPGKGKFGKRCIVMANHFFAELPDLHQYDVTITPEVTSRGMNRAVITQLVKLYKVSYLGNRLSAYDGRKSLYTAGPLPFISKDFKITLLDEDDGSGRREREFKVAIKLASRADLHHLGMFLKGKQADAPQEVLQVLDIVLRELTTNKYTPVGRSFYDPHLGQRRFDEGLEIWRGFYQSIRPTQMGVSLNIDMSSTVFIEPLPVIVFVTELLNRDVTAGPLSDSDCVKIKEALRGVKVEVTHRGNMRRKYRISGLTSQATRELNFLVNESGMMKSVVEYFRERYGFVIQHIQWPCLQVGNPQRPNYLPMEVCKIVKGQRYSKRLSESQITALPHVTYQRPQDMEKDILKTVAHNNYANDDYAKEFGIKISPELASVEARILPPPWLKYHDTGREKDCLPERGVWSMMNKKMVNGGIVASWICINFADEVQDSTASTFCRELANMCNISGMEFNPDPVFPAFSARPDRVERVLKACFHEAMTRLQPQGKELDLLIVILPNKNGSLYGDLKRICETDIGIVSQCCLTKHVFKMSLQYLSNVALKINVKVGGRNTVLRDAISRRIPNVSDDPTIIFGADVIHPHPGEDSSPSIAAVVASQDWPEITKYACLVCAQPHRQELIQDLYKDKDSGGMIKELLISFHRATGRKPQRIIFYRYGVSEGQFYQVLLYELDAIRKACASLEPNYQPPVTFVVVQKRHHTRLFANNHQDRNSTDRSGNILPGTVVDSKICHPTEFDFYLCSHAGIQGTSRPAHYHVLWDENKFEADALQSLTNNLCYTYARCTRSVSIVPPAYYAHLAAFRARFYMEPDTSDSGSMTSGAAGRGGMGVRNTRVPGANAAVRPLPALKENVKRVMFYC